MKDIITVNVYADNGEIVKTCKARTASIKFGTIRALMRLLNVEKMEDTSEMLGAIYDAWGEVIRLLNDCFPEMENEDWDNVPVSEVLSVLLGIIKSSFSEMKNIQVGGSEKN